MPRISMAPIFDPLPPTQSGSGLDNEGEAVLFTPTWDRTVERYPLGQFEAIPSSLTDRRALSEQIVAEVSSGLPRTYEQLQATFAQSLAAQQQVLPNVAQVVTEM